MSSSEVLVIGARPGSIGDAVAQRLRLEGDWQVTTAGISGEMIKVDITGALEVLMGDRWDHVVCTVGLNEETDFESPAFDFEMHMQRMWDLNCFYPILALRHWLKHRPVWERFSPEDVNNFVFMSSNSASVPRSRSLGYCASKAALSHAVRCAARKAPPGVSIYAYEPGWVLDTPMSEEVAARLPTHVPPMRGGHPISVDDLAELVVTNLQFETQALNGMTIRLDGGEQ